MTKSGSRDADVIVLGGGTFGATVAGLLAVDGVETVVAEGDIHPLQHVGEALAPSANVVFERLGVLDKLDDAGFPHRRTALWSARSSLPGAFAEIPLFEPAVEGSPRPYAYLAERGELDTILLRQAHELGAKVLQGVDATQIFHDDRGTAVGVHVRIVDGWERDLTAAVVVDATRDRRCTLGSARSAPVGPVRLSSVFGDVVRPPALDDHSSISYQLADRRWAWQLPMKNGRTSIGIVLQPDDLPSAEDDLEATFASLAEQNGTFASTIQEAERLRPFELVGPGRSDDPRAGPDRITAGDACELADPILLSWADAAVWSAVHAHEAIIAALERGATEEAFDRYAERLSRAKGVWGDLATIVQERADDVGPRAADPPGREGLARVLHDDPFDEATLTQVRALLDELQPSDQETLAGS